MEIGDEPEEMMGRGEGRGGGDGEEERKREEGLEQGGGGGNSGRKEIGAEPGELMRGRDMGVVERNLLESILQGTFPCGGSGSLTLTLTQSAGMWNKGSSQRLTSRMIRLTFLPLLPLLHGSCWLKENRLVSIFLPPPPLPEHSTFPLASFLSHMKL